MYLQTFRLLHEEGFFVGASSGLNVAAAVKVSHQLVVCTCRCHILGVCISHTQGWGQLQKFTITSMISIILQLQLHDGRNYKVKEMVNYDSKLSEIK